MCIRDRAKELILDGAEFLEKISDESHKRTRYILSQGSVLLSRGVFQNEVDLLNSKRTVVAPVTKCEDSTLDEALEQLASGQSYLRRNLHSQATDMLNQAIIRLRTLNRDFDLLNGLLARAALHRHTRDFARARQNLQEVFDIADGSGMRLHLTDYHLEMARLLVAEEKEGVCNTPLQLSLIHI